MAKNTKQRIPTLRPHQMIKVAATLQVVVLVLAALTEHFIFGFAIGNFIIAVLFMLPPMLRPADAKVHWVKPQE